ncbi:MAG: GGDEF domain-containing protein [Paracoccus sp. (in: a-proteobacteria)]|nr:GGDEF domain-containing protein [Paracoccus sp. (in: a-proteobacteria)]
MRRRIVLIEHNMTERLANKTRLAAAGYAVDAYERPPARIEGAGLVVFAAPRGGAVAQRCGAVRALAAQSPLLVIAPPDAAGEAYLSGADQVVAPDAPPALLLARCRAAMSSPRPAEAARQAAGFAEPAAAGFAHRRCAALVRIGAGGDVRAGLAAAGYHVRLMSAGDLLAATPREEWPDLIALAAAPGEADRLIALVAALRQQMNEAPRSCAIVAVLPRCAADHEAVLLDVGAGEVLFDDQLGGDGGSATSLRLRAAQRRAQLIARQHARALEEQQLATQDPLTGLYNRRYLMPRLEAALYGSAGGAVLVLDLDRFKAINDRHGHAAGDAVLQEVGAILSAAAGAAFDAARMGGEEFVLLMPAAAEAEAVALAEHIRARICGRPITVPGLSGNMQLRVTASVGVAAFGPGHAGDAASVLAAADRALIKAKRAGRNLVLLAREGPAGRHVMAGTVAPICA